MITPALPPSPESDVVVFDVGNTNITIGVWSRGVFRSVKKLPHDLTTSLQSTIQEFWSATVPPRSAICCSVVPDSLEAFRTYTQDLISSPLLVIGREIPVPITIAVEQPETVGMDRLCNALAAYHIERQACVVVDLGTAITIDCVDAEGSFLGGAILPGMKLQATALASGTAQLPLVPIDIPANPLGQHTQQAIQAGIVLGCAGAIRELAERYATILGHWPTLLATGGDAEMMAQVADVIDKVVPNLCMRGAVLAFEKMCSSHRASAS